MASPTTSTSRAPQTGDAALDIAVSGFKWNLGSDRTIDWSLSNGALGETWPDRAAMLTAAGQALASIATFIDVKFNYVGSFSDPASAAAAGSEINVAPTRDRTATPDSVLGFSFYPRTGDGTKAGDVSINLNSIAADYPPFTPGTAGFQLILHELGHSLGLKHPFESDGAGRLTIEATRFAARDTDWFSLMAYNDPYQSNRTKFEPATPMPLDVTGLQYLYGPNRATGASDSVYSLTVTETYASFWDAGGVDTVSAAQSDVGWEINLGWDRLSTLSPNWTGFAMPAADRQFPAPHSLYWFIGDFETVVGSGFADKITGSVLPNRIRGGGSDDYIDGFQGRDTAVYDGLSIDFSWLRKANGEWTVADLRNGRPEGIDTLHRIEVLAFNDREVELAPRLSPALETAFRMILRADGYSPTNILLATALAPLPTPAAVARLVQEADATTSVVTLAYQFFTGRLPTELNIDDLVSTTSPNLRGLNLDAYQALSVENRYISFALDLGKTGEARAAFLAGYGAKSLLDTVKSAYLTIFGSTPSDEKAHAILDGRIGYFTAWGGDGANGIGTKAAIVGFLLSEAAKTDVGTLQTANIAFLTDLADGAAFSVDLVGTYQGTPYFG